MPFFSEIISQHSADSVERCYDSIELIAIEGRKKMRFNHFIMFPLSLDENFMQRYKKFQDEARNLKDIPVSRFTQEWLIFGIDSNETKRMK